MSNVEAASEFRSLVRKLRPAAGLEVALVPSTGASPKQVADAAATAAGGSPLQGAWESISEAHAVAFLRSMLTFDLAYHVRCMSDAQAAELSAAFFSLVPPPTTFLVNASGLDWRSLLAGGRPANYQYTPVTTHTFSLAVVTVGAGQAAILLIGDED